jgi:integrase
VNTSPQSPIERPETSGRSSTGHWKWPIWGISWGRLGHVTLAFGRLCQQKGTTAMRLHDLRHYAASRLLGAGVPVKTYPHGVVERFNEQRSSPANPDTADSAVPLARAEGRRRVSAWWDSKRLGYASI